MKRAFTLIELLIVIAIIAILALIAIPNFIEAQTRAKVSRAHADMRSLATALESYFVDNNAYPRADTRNTADHTSLAFGRALWRDFDHGDASLEGSFCVTLTTPIGYFSGHAPADPFRIGSGTDIEGNNASNFSFFYYNFLDAARHRLHWDKWYIKPGGPEQSPPQVTSPAPLRFNSPGAGPGNRSGLGKINHANWALACFGPDAQPDAPYDATRFLWNNENYVNLIYGRTTLYDPTNGTVSMGLIWRLTSSQDD